MFQLEGAMSNLLLEIPIFVLLNYTSFQHPSILCSLRFRVNNHPALEAHFQDIRQVKRFFLPYQSSFLPAKFHLSIKINFTLKTSIKTFFKEKYQYSFYSNLYESMKPFYEALCLWKFVSCTFLKH